MKKILFPTDFSVTAENAFIYALRLAEKTGASITTLHCYEMPNLSHANLPYTIREAYESINLEEFENYRDSVPVLRDIAKNSGMAHVKVNHILVEGEAISCITRHARKEKADLIVMGTTGASGMKEIFLGTVAAEVMENAPCPVLAVPKEAKFDGKLDRLAITTEFKLEEKKALDWLIAWSAEFKPEIYCLNVDLAHTDPIVRRMDKLRAEYQDYKNLHFKVIDSTNLEASLSKYLKENKIDVLAMVIHQRNFFKELFSYSMTKKMSYHLKQPILAIQASSMILKKGSKKKRNRPGLSLSGIH